jgi:RNA recognition motif-containing protein
LESKINTSPRAFHCCRFNPVSARVVFADPEGISSGYGFVSFATREEAENAITKLKLNFSSLDNKNNK